MSSSHNRTLQYVGTSIQNFETVWKGIPAMQMVWDSIRQRGTPDVRDIVLSLINIEIEPTVFQNIVYIVIVCPILILQLPLFRLVLIMKMSLWM